MKILGIKDNSQISQDDFSEIKNITDKIADKTIEQLEREGILIFPTVGAYRDVTSDQTVLQSFNGAYRTGNVMGFIGYKNERLVIRSRFCKKDDDFFLRYLLGKVLNFPNIVDLETDADRDGGMLNLFVFLFPGYLKNAVKKGLFKTYIRRSYNDGNVKGTIDIARNIKENTPFAGKIAYVRREYSQDNDLTELVRHTIEFIKKKSYGHKLLAQVKDEVKLVVDATPTFVQCDRQKIMEKNKKNAIRHAFYHEYRALQRLCILILQQQRHRIGTGIQSMCGILFDGAWLWEEYINTLIKDLFYHPMNKCGSGAQRLFCSHTGLIYPDFISRAESPRTIADAKYKPVDNIRNKDYLQVLAYMFRFDAKTGYYLYPEIDDAENLRLWLNKGSTYEGNVESRNDISVVKLGLKIPTADSYDRFVKEMRQSESEFKKEFL